MLAVLPLGQNRAQIERARGIALVVMYRDHVLELRRAQLLAERRRLRRTRAVVKAEAFALRHHLPDHGYHRRHADAAGDEEKILRARRQAKIVHWRDYREFIASLHIVDQAA